MCTHKHRGTRRRVCIERRDICESQEISKQLALLCIGSVWCTREEYLQDFERGGGSSLLAIYFPRYLYALFCLKAYSLKVKQHQSSLLTLFYWNQKMKLPETFNLVLAFISQQSSQNKVKKSRGSYPQETTRQSAGGDVCFCQNPWNVLNKPQLSLHSKPQFCLI